MRDLYHQCVVVLTYTGEADPYWRSVLWQRTWIRDSTGRALPGDLWRSGEGDRPPGWWIHLESRILQVREVGPNYKPRRMRSLLTPDEGGIKLPPMGRLVNIVARAPGESRSWHYMPDKGDVWYATDLGLG